MGDRVVTVGGAPFHLRGYRVARATLEDLLGVAPPAAGPDFEIVLAGTSAGGLGALFHAARVRAGVRVRLITDSSSFLNFDNAVASQVGRGRSQARQGCRARQPFNPLARALAPACVRACSAFLLPHSSYHACLAGHGAKQARPCSALWRARLVLLLPRPQPHTARPS